ncbi:MAG: dephospho-CoA kinase [Cytophagaceae bacterium]|jgi:dephospho-CoA kinase|nr:dephospho-CoA kinase [Cytophagaceae bacterium]
MWQIGITGGIGSGKSTIAAFFKVLGIPVYDADSRAKWLTEHHPNIQKILIEWLGASAFIEGKLNKQFIAEKVFAKPTELQKLNQIIHPIVGEDFKHWVKEQQAPYILKEAALLFESGSYKSLDKIIVVTAPESERIKRVLLRDPQRSEAQVKEILQRQWPEADKVERADWVINNDNTTLLLPKLLNFHQILLSSHSFS